MKKIFKILMVIALVLLINPVIGHAEVNKDLFKADYDITVNEEMDGSSFIAGNSVAINNKINGILFGAGNTVNVNGESEYAFVAGNIINLNGSSFKDGFVAGQMIEINDANVLRDLYVAGQNIKITGSVGRNLFVAGSDVVIDGVINGDVYVDATNLTINSDAVIKGKLKYNEDTKEIISKDASIGYTETYKNKTNTEVDAKASLGSIILNKVINTLLNLLNILVVGLLMVLLIPNLFKKLKELEANKLLPSFAWGLLILIVLPIIALILMITYIGVATSIISIVLYFVLMYISTILSTYYVTSLLLKDKVKNPYLVLLIGLSCLYIIKLIPFIGGLTTFAMICLGMGLITNLIKRR